MRKTQCVNFVTHLECADCGKHYPAGQLHNLCTDCHRPLWVRYDLGQLRDCFPRELLAGRPSDLWRYRELLPYVDAANVVSLGETATPILPASRLGAELGLANLQIKDESRLPTGSFKARGMAMAITMANEFGIRRVACPTAGNAGGAMAAYASRAGMESFVFMPDDTPVINLKETHLAGAGFLDAANRPQGGTLARPVGADQRDDFALVYLNRDAVQGLDLAVVGMNVFQY